ncbi:MAG TPA: hypothetical protein VJ746_06055 [Nitrospira sp.]|nr:hypothetical protein [Nitrospira sp.]
MNCRRCQGCMTRDHFVDLMESGGEWWTVSWRCINCGWVLDPVLERNRLKQQSHMPALSGPAVLQQDDRENNLPTLDVAA